MKGRNTMTPEEMRQQVAVRNAVVSQLHSCGMRPLQNTEPAILAWFKSRGCTLSAERGYLEVTQADGNAAVPSSACETLRKELPHLFVPDPKRDEISSLEGLSRGTPQERLKARAAFIAKHGLDAFEALPKTQKEAERKSVAPSPDMTRKEYLGLSLREKSQLAGI